jgi:hypothetical protein
MLKLGNNNNDNNKNDDDDDSQSPASPPTQPTPRLAAPAAHAEAEKAAAEAEKAAAEAARAMRRTPRAPPAFAEATQLSQASVSCASTVRKRRREPLFANLTVLITGVKLASDAARQREVKQLTALVTSHGGTVLDRLPPIQPTARATATKGKATAAAVPASAEAAVATVTTPSSPWPFFRVL